MSYFAFTTLLDRGIMFAFLAFVVWVGVRGRRE